MKLLFLLLFYSGFSHAVGPYLMAGAGVNVSYYEAKGQKTKLGPGVSFKTDLGYFFDPNWALEWSSQVKFNKVSELFVWDTLMTIGVRYKFDESPYYTRFFFGRSPTVIFLDDAPKVVKETNATRIQFNGPVYGLGVGKTFEKKNGSVWFVEGTLSYQRLVERKGIRNDGNYPVEVFVEHVNNPLHIFSVYATVGIRIF